MELTISSLLSAYRVALKPAQLSGRLVRCSEPPSQGRMPTYTTNKNLAPEEEDEAIVESLGALLWT